MPKLVKKLAIIEKNLEKKGIISILTKKYIKIIIWGWPMIKNME